MFYTKDINTDSVKIVSRAKGVVISNSDPLKKGRIQVETPLLGRTVWIPYLQQPFSFDVPEPGDIVYVECDGGYETHALAFGKLLTDQAEETKLPSEFKRETPSNRGFYTPGGHLIELDDGENGIRITSAGGIKLHLDDNENEIFINANNNTILLDADGIVLEDKNNNTITTRSNGISLVDNNNNQIETSSSGVEIKSSEGQKATIGSGEVLLEDGSGGQFKASGGQIAAGSSSVELVDILVTFLNELATDQFAGMGAPAGKAALYLQLATQLETIKGSL